MLRNKLRIFPHRDIRIQMGKCLMGKKTKVEDESAGSGRVRNRPGGWNVRDRRGIVVIAVAVRDPRGPSLTA